MMCLYTIIGWSFAAQAFTPWELHLPYDEAVQWVEKEKALYPAVYDGTEYPKIIKEEGW